MAGAPKEIVIGIKIEPVVMLNCRKYTCLHQLKDGDFCNLKRVKLGMDGECTSYLASNPNLR